MDGSPLAPPVVVDHGGPIDRITLEDEYDSHTWLSNFMAKDGKLHFVYLAQASRSRQHYVRYDQTTARREQDVWPFRGEQVALYGLDGFFATRVSLPDGPLYCVHRDGGRIACLASDDNGETWYDYAVSEGNLSPYSIGGCRELTADGYIIGTFTEQKFSPADTEGKSPVYFIKIRAGLSRARVAAARYANGRAMLRFSQVRGQPERVRFRQEDGAWGEWLPFERTMTVEMDALPTGFQLTSRLGVVSATIEIGDAETLTAGYMMSWNYPNPFNARTRITYQLPEAADVSVAVYNVLGQRICRLKEGHREAGLHEASWDGRTEDGTPASSGIYLCRFRGRGFVRTRPMLLVR